MAKETEKTEFVSGLILGLSKSRFYNDKTYSFNLFVSDGNGIFDSIKVSEKDLEKLSMKFGIEVKEI